jgi:hypothetical protein
MKLYVGSNGVARHTHRKVVGRMVIARVAGAAIVALAEPECILPYVLGLQRIHDLANNSVQVVYHGVIELPVAIEVCRVGSLLLVQSISSTGY